MGDEQLTVEQVADRILAMVRETVPANIGKRGDTAGHVMWGAYARGYRRFQAIRLLAGAEVGDESMILARSLLSMLGRAVYVLHDDFDERSRRYAQYAKRQLQDDLNTAEHLAAAVGIGVGRDIEEIRADLAEMADVKMLPNDALLLKQVGLEAFYARLYRVASDPMHFSLREAIGDVYGADVVAMNQPQPERADEALRLATVTYALLLQATEYTLGHDVGTRALDLIKASDAFKVAGVDLQRASRRASPSPPTSEP